MLHVSPQPLLCRPLSRLPSYLSDCTFCLLCSFIALGLGSLHTQSFLRSSTEEASTLTQMSPNLYPWPHLLSPSPIDPLLDPPSGRPKDTSN